MNEQVIAGINLNAVLRSLELLCEIDSASKEKIHGVNLGIRFSVPKLPPMTLVFSNGQLKAKYGKDVKSNINLAFRNQEHFNKMVEGKAMPIPTKGFLKLGFLQGTFTELTKILESYLKPNVEILKTDNAFRDKNTKLTAFVAFCALSEIANYDAVGQKVASHTPNGRMVIQVAGEPFIVVDIEEGKFCSHRNNFDNPTAIMAFDSLETAGGILRGELDSFEAIGRGNLRISGKIHIVDNLNKLLGLVETYL